MITARAFSQKLVFVICAIFSLWIVQAAVPFSGLLLDMIIDARDRSLFMFTLNAIFGLALGLRGRVGLLSFFSLVALSLFYPIAAGVLFLILTFIEPSHER